MTREELKQQLIDINTKREEIQNEYRKTKNALDEFSDELYYGMQKVETKLNDPEIACYPDMVALYEEEVEHFQKTRQEHYRIYDEIDDEYSRKIRSLENEEDVIRHDIARLDNAEGEDEKRYV